MTLEMSRNILSWPNEFMFEISNIVIYNKLTLANVSYLMPFV